MRVPKAIEQMRADFTMSADQSCREVNPSLEAPRGDLCVAVNCLRAAFEHFRVEITAAIRSDRNILLTWIILLMIAQVGVFAALVRLL